MSAETYQIDTVQRCARCDHAADELGAKVFVGEREFSLCHGCNQDHRCYEKHLADVTPSTGGDKANLSTPTGAGSKYLEELTAHVRTTSHSNPSEDTP